MKTLNSVLYPEMMTVSNQDFQFEVTATAADCAARTGQLTTRRGVVVETPVFMPVGTQASLKGIDHQQMVDSGIHLILANAYHLYLRPGHSLISKAGGLHGFMNYDGAMLTDSGGYQVFSLSALMKVTDAGIHLRSHLDGSKHFYTPELVVEINRGLRPDIMMVLDECSPWPVDYKRAETAVRRTTLWAERTLAAVREIPPEDFPVEPFCIVQGAFDHGLRKRSLEELLPLGYRGLAIGGLSVGEPRDVLLEMLTELMPQIPRTLPRYFMGLGTIPDLLDAVELGVDMFDCVLPTRLGRHGAMLLPDGGRLNLRNAKFKERFEPPVAGCDCSCCSRFTLAYISHLIRAGEILGMVLCSMHNIHVLSRMMIGARAAIQSGSFKEYKRKVLSGSSSRKELIPDDRN